MLYVSQSGLSGASGIVSSLYRRCMLCRDEGRCISTSANIGQKWGTRQLRNCLPGPQLAYFHVLYQLTELAWTAGEHRERCEVHGDDRLRLQQVTSIRGFARAHSVVIANGQHRDL